MSTFGLETCTNTSDLYLFTIQNDHLCMNIKDTFWQQQQYQQQYQQPQPEPYITQMLTFAYSLLLTSILSFTK